MGKGWDGMGHGVIYPGVTAPLHFMKKGESKIIRAMRVFGNGLYQVEGTETTYNAKSAVCMRMYSTNMNCNRCESLGIRFPLPITPFMIPISLAIPIP